MILDLGFVAVLAVVAVGLGDRVLGALDERPDHPRDAWAWALTLGLGVLALAAAGLGLVGALTPVGLGVLGVVALGLGIGPGLGASLDAVDLGVPPVGWLNRWVLVLGRLVVAATLIAALVPVTDGDALCYHLQVPKVFLAAGRLVFEPDLHETIYPLLTEMLYALALAARGPVAARLVHWLLGLAFALIVAALARPSLGDARARWAGTIALLTPAVSNGMAAPLNDVALAAFGNAAILAWVRWCEAPSPRRAALAGACLGLALGVKYPALVLGGVLALSVVALAPRDLLIRRRLAHAGLFGLAALLVGGVWYARAWGATGNPVFPFFRGVFGGAGLDEVLDPIKRPMPVTPWSVLTVLRPLTLDPDRFDSFSHQLGPVFLLFVPALLWVWPPRSVGRLVGIGYAFLALCVTQRQSMRFLLIAVGPLSVGAAWLAARWADRARRPGAWSARGLVLILLACLLFEASLATLRAQRAARYLLGRESAEAYLARVEPTFVVGRWIDANLPADARIVGQDHRGFYIPRAYAMELAHRRRTGLGSRGESADSVIATLHDRGFTHLLLSIPDPIDAVEFDSTLSRLLDPWLEAQRPIYDQPLADADGVVRRYIIYPLAGGP